MLFGEMILNIAKEIPHLSIEKLGQIPPSVFGVFVY